jgi:hypothetical protein
MATSRSSTLLSDLFDISSLRIWSPMAKQRVAEIVQFAVHTSPSDANFAWVSAIGGRRAQAELGIKSEVVFGKVECLVGANSELDMVRRGPGHAWLRTDQGEVVDFSVAGWREGADPKITWQITPQLHWDAAEVFRSDDHPILGYAWYDEDEAEPRQEPAFPTVGALSSTLIALRLHDEFPREVIIAEHEENVRTDYSSIEGQSVPQRRLFIQRAELAIQQRRSRDRDEQDWLEAKWARVDEQWTKARMSPGKQRR